MVRMPKPRMYTIKITLENIRPPVWRRIVVPDALTLGHLHSVIQIAMGWFDGHLHEFKVGDRSYSSTQDEFDDFNESLPEWDIMLRTIFQRGIKKFHYTYDFGDDWRHKIEIEKSEPLDPERSFPQLITGRRNCPPEDVGGPYGYAEFLEALTDPNHDRHEEYTEWLGVPFDPTFFDHAEIAKQLAQWASGVSYIG
jgi:hypothetical protein